MASFLLCTFSASREYLSHEKDVFRCIGESVLALPWPKEDVPSTYLLWNFTLPHNFYIPKSVGNMSVFSSIVCSASYSRITDLRLRILRQSRTSRNQLLFEGWSKLTQALGLSTTPRDAGFSPFGQRYQEATAIAMERVEGTFFMVTLARIFHASRPVVTATVNIDIHPDALEPLLCDPLFKCRVQVFRGSAGLPDGKPILTVLWPQFMKYSGKMARFFLPGCTIVTWCEIKRKQ